MPTTPMWRSTAASFIADQALDELPRPSVLGRAKLGGVDLNQPRMRAALAGVLTLAASPGASPSPSSPPRSSR
jgi:hypothetical protein